MSRLYKLLTLVFLILQTSVIIGQSKKVKKTPNIFLSPILYDTEVGRQDFMYKEDKASKNNLWLVISDRSNNPLYANPDENGRSSGNKLKFKQYAYVIKEKGAYLLLANGRLDRGSGKLVNAKEIGWVKKDKVLLWTSSLKDLRSKILVKAFLMNSTEEIAKIMSKSLKSAEIYDGPRSSKVIGDKSLYNVYFVYKEEANRVLIGPNNSIYEGNVDLIGWVDKSRVSLWNTRLVVEPSYDPEAFEERQSKKDRRIKAFNSRGNAAKYNSKSNEEGVLWDNDPIILDRSKLARSNLRRHLGGVFRFPVLSASKDYLVSSSVNEIKTNTGKLDEIALAQMQKDLAKLGNKKNNMNILFVVETTREMESNKATILSIIESIDKDLPNNVNVKYAGVSYKDVFSKNSGEDCIVLPLTNSVSDIIGFFNDTNFDQGYDDLDPFTITRYALMEGLQKSGLGSQQMNTIIVIGNGADIFYDRGRKIAAKSSGDRKYLVDPSDIENRLEVLNANLIFIQPKNVNEKYSVKYLSGARGLISETANSMYNEYSLISTKYYPNTQVRIPVMDEIEQPGNLMLNNGVQYASIIRNKNGTLSADQMITECNKAVVKISQRTSDLYNAIDKMVNMGDGLQIEKKGNEWDPAILQYISDSFEKAKIDKSIEDASLQKLVDEKIKLHHQVFLPKKISGLEYPPYSYGVFMPHVELEEYNSYLLNLNRSLRTSPDQQREALYSAVESLVLQLSGNKSLKEVKNTSMDELRFLMAGIVADSGFNFNKKMGFNIGDIKDKRAISDLMINEIGKDIGEKAKQISSIMKEGKNYEFSYSTNENSIYYWLPVDVLF